MRTLALVFAVGAALAAGPAHACSGVELVQKQKALGDAVKAALGRDPGGDTARQTQAQTIIGRYSGLKPGPGGYLIERLLSSIALPASRAVTKFGPVGRTCPWAGKRP